MGERGREKVLNQSIEHVVADILQWYKVGKRRSVDIGFLTRIFRLVLLICFVPVAVVAMQSYEFLVSLVHS
jgi:hypothetical protein